jgi:hypothetical protein
MHGQDESDDEDDGVDEHDAEGDSMDNDESAKVNIAASSPSPSSL